MAFVLRRANTPAYLFIHHSATSVHIAARTLMANSLHFVEDKARVRQLKAAGYVSDYHSYIDSAGNVYEGQPEHFNCVHAYWDEYNNHSLAICAIANFNLAPPSEAQLAGIVAKAKVYIKKYPIEKIYPHSYAVNTACPGSLFPWPEFIKRVYSAKTEIRLQIKSEIMKVGKDPRKLEIYPFITDDPGRAGGVTVAPLRAVAEALGASIEWEPNTKTVIVRGRNPNVELRLQVRNPIMLVNGEPHMLSIFPFVAQGVLVCPLRAYVEALGAALTWEEETKSILIIKEG